MSAGAEAAGPEGFSGVGGLSQLIETYSRTEAVRGVVPTRASRLGRAAASGVLRPDVRAG